MSLDPERLDALQSRCDNLARRMDVIEALDSMKSVAVEDSTDYLGPRDKKEVEKVLNRRGRTDETEADAELCMWVVQFQDPEGYSQITPIKVKASSQEGAVKLAREHLLRAWPKNEAQKYRAKSFTPKFAVKAA